jgi:MFS family permease
MKTRLWLSESFPALGHAEYRRYWLAMTLSNTGTWMQNIVLPWLAYRLTDSALLLGLVGVCQYGPALLLSLAAGVVIDRFPRRTILIITQALSLAVTGVMAILQLSGRLGFAHILALSAVLGLVNTVDMPARQAFVIETVGREHLQNAIALNMSTFNVARILGPAIASVAMAAADPGWCLLYNSLSFAFVVYAVLRVKRARRPGPAPRPASLREFLRRIMEGLSYARRDPVLLSSLAGSAIIGTLAFNFSVLLPVFSATILRSGPQGFALLMSAMGVGSLIGALSMALLSRRGLGSRYHPAIGCAVGLALIGIGCMRVLPASAFFMAVAGILTVIFTNITQSTLQLKVDEDYRGRVTSMNTLVTMGSTPVGNLFVGIVAEAAGAAVAFMASGGTIILLFAACIFFGLYSRQREPGAVKGEEE